MFVPIYLRVTILLGMKEKGVWVLGCVFQTLHTVRKWIIYVAETSSKIKSRRISSQQEILQHTLQSFPDGTST